MKKYKMSRQNIRKLLLISSLLLFPITIYYFSPYLIIQGGLDGVITGSFVVFISMLISSPVLGRIFCGYLCPAGGLQECAMQVNDSVPKQGWKNNIKYIIWTIWICGVIISFIFRKNYLRVDILYGTEYGISVANIYSYIIYYGIILLVFLPAVFLGRRVFCHYFCWMAPFMVIGSRIGRLIGIKRLQMKGSSQKCISCRMCDKICPMGINVSQKVKLEDMSDDECILCGACIDKCPKKAITYNFTTKQ